MQIEKKRPADWLRTEETKQYLQARAVMLKCASADLVQIRQGGVPANQQLKPRALHVL